MPFKFLDICLGLGLRIVGDVLALKNEPSRSCSSFLSLHISFFILFCSQVQNFCTRVPFFLLTGKCTNTTTRSHLKNSATKFGFFVEDCKLVAWNHHRFWNMCSTPLAWIWFLKIEGIKFLDFVSTFDFPTHTRAP